MILLATGGAIGQMKMPMCHPADSGDPVPPEQLPAPQVIAGAGNVRFPITANAKAQMWFEQGINLLYDFWDYEADRAFEESIRADAKCAMCYWGLYQAEAFNHSVTKSYAQDSLTKAVALKGHASKREKLYIEASEAHEAAIREAGSEDKAKFDHEIEILRTLVRKNPHDTNARIALAGEVADGYDPAGEPRKGKKEELAILQGVLKEEPENSAANHLWIHAVEASPHPEQALHSAEILASLAPASGHMVHMPGHIFYRTGDYARAQTAFDASALADENYMRQQHVAVDNDWNYVHNLMYSVANLMELGQLAAGGAGFGQTWPLRAAIWRIPSIPGQPGMRLRVSILTSRLLCARRTGSASSSWSMPRSFPRIAAHGIPRRRTFPIRSRDAVGGRPRTRCGRAPCRVAGC